MFLIEVKWKQILVFIRDACLLVNMHTSKPTLSWNLGVNFFCQVRLISKEPRLALLILNPNLFPSNFGRKLDQNLIHTVNMAMKATASKQ